MPEQTTDRTHYVVEDGDNGVGVIVQRWIELNPDQVGPGRTFRNFAAVRDWFYANNNFRNPRTGERCDGVRVTGEVIRPGDVINVPDGNPISGVAKAQDCPPVEEIRREEPAVTAPPPEEQPARQPRPLAQFIPQSRGAWREAVGSDGMNYFLGRPPVDAAARRRGRRDEIEDGAYQPGESEGARVENPGEQRRELDRRTYGENTYRPSQTVFVDDNGEPIGPNDEYEQKIEQNARYTIDANGQLAVVVDGNALISINRRINPYYEGIFSDVRTARNVITQWNNTAEGRMAITTWAGIDRQYQVIGDRYFNAEPAARSAEDAERLLQLNVQAALHPLMWSVSSQGVPVGNTDVLRTQAERVLAEMPDGPEKQRLEAAYRPYLALLDDPVALDRAIQQNGGRANWYNPMIDWAHERHDENEFIRDHYDDVPMERPRHPGSNATRAEREAYREAMREYNEAREGRAREVGEIYGRRFWSDTIRPPTETEQAFGRGELSDAARQSEPALREQRIAFLRRMETDPEFRRAVIDSVMSTPGALQYWTDPLLYASRQEDGQSQLLAFDRERDADRFVDSVSGQLTGDEDALAYRDRNIGTDLTRGFAQLITLGHWSPYDNRNQNTGLGVEPDVRRRWNGGEGPSAADVDEAFRRMAERYRMAEELNPPESAPSTAAVLSVSPNIVEDANNGRFSPEYERLLALATPEQRRLMYDQMVANLDRIGSVTAGMEAQLERDVIDGRRTPDETGRFDTTAAATATTPEERARVLIQANNPDLVNQGQVDRNTLLAMQQTSPAAFSLLVAMSAASGEGSAQARQNLPVYIESVSGRSANGRAYGRLMDEHIAAIRAAGNNAEARAAALDAASRAFNDFFADPEHGGERVATTQVLAQLMAGSTDVTALFAGQYAQFAVTNPGEFLNGLVERGAISREQAMQLLALQAGRTPEERAAGFQRWLETVAQPGQDSLNAYNGVSWVEMVKMALIVAGATIPGGGSTPMLPRTPVPNCGLDPGVVC